MSDAKKQLPDPLVRLRTFPEPDKVFEFSPVSLEEALKNGLVVVDTNVLLLPYTVGQATLQQIRSVFEQLTRENRLRVPGQVAREFADNRAEKLKNLYQQLSAKRNVPLRQDRYPLLETDEKYTELLRCEEELADKIKTYRKLIGEVLATVEGWNWDDPVSMIYREFFEQSLIVDPQFERSDVLADLQYRCDHQIPPGYKDSGNEHSGIGDFLIWKTILHLAENEKRHLVFVSGEGKSDWWYRSDGRPLYPRFELIDEYRRASGGKSFLIAGFAELLAKLGVSEQTIAEVKKEEVGSASLQERAKAVEKELARIETQFRRTGEEAAVDAVLKWLQTIYSATHVIRTSEFPDFLVETEGGYEGFEVTFARYPNHATLRLRVILSRFRGATAGREGALKLTAVFVTENRDNAAYMRTALLRSYQGATGFRVLIGVIDREGAFDPTFSIDSPEIAHSED